MIYGRLFITLRRGDFLTPVGPNYRISPVIILLLVRGPHYSPPVGGGALETARREQQVPLLAGAGYLPGGGDLFIDLCCLCNASSILYVVGLHCRQCIVRSR